MAYARVLRVVGLAVALAAAPVARAAGGCEEEADRTGLRMRVQSGALVVDAVAPGSPAAASGLRTGDTVVQVNATVPASCSEWARAVRDARDERKALLVLVRRDEADVPVAVAATAAWGIAVAEPAPTRPAPPADRPAFPAPTPPPPPLPEDVTVSYDSVRRDLETLVPAGDPPASLREYRKALRRVLRGIATLGARKAVPADAIAQLRLALRPYEAAEVAWDAVEGERERERRSRRLPVADETTRPFFEDSQAAAVLDEFPFLRDTVVRAPEGGIIETAGLWRPLQARTLLWQHGREGLGRLPAAPQ